MTAEEKIKALESALSGQLSWFKKCELDKENYDDSYTYDMACEEFGRDDCYNVLAILADI